MGAHRRRTDLIPTILMGRDRGSTPSTPGRAVSMSRIDQLAVPRSQLGKGMSKSVNSKSMSHLALKKTSGQAANRTTGHQRAATAAQPARKPGGSTLFQTTFTSIDRNLKKGLLISSPVARCKVFKILSLPFRFMDYLTPKCIIFFCKGLGFLPPPLTQFPNYFLKGSLCTFLKAAQR